MNKIYLTFFGSFFFLWSTAQHISLSGKWEVRLGSSDSKEYLVNLPGTLDDAGIGEPVQIAPSLTIATLDHLQRKVQFVGKAFYTRTFSIPFNWKNKIITLNLGRVLWQSTVMIDGKKLAVSQESLVSSHFFDITDYVSSGRQHKLTICIDNSNLYPGINIYASQYPSKESSEMVHSYTNHTQIKWNGILGDISIVAKPRLFIDEVIVNPDLQKRQLQVQYKLKNQNAAKVYLQSYVVDSSINKKWPVKISLANLENVVFKTTFPIPDNAIYWSEFSPRLYHLVSIIKSAYGIDTLVTTFGLRELSTKKGDLYLNDNRIFIRGNLECVIFPLKGYPPMQTREWEQLFKTAKTYGLNTFRFHSWCPPDVAFRAADKLGFYLQVELPHWNLKVGEDTAAFRFLQQEAHRILKAYGNHPSFLFFSMGNELEGDFNKLNNLVAELKKIDKRHLYSTTTFTFQKEITGDPQPQDDYYVTQWTQKGWTRGQGVFNDESPNFSKDYSKSIDGIDIPIISHEIGQYCVYPDINEIDKYTGNLVPLNFIAIKEDLRKKGLLHLAPSFLDASGRFAALLYKEEIERALKTKGFDGFQLLQMQDFPGQGTALVGLLNAFWKTKGFITAKEFRKYCSEVTPLIRFPKPVYTNNEVFEADVELANFYKPLKNAELVWNVKEENGAILKSGTFGKKDYAIDNGLQAGKITVDLAAIKTAKKLMVEVLIKGTTYRNDWNIWVYPANIKEEVGNVLVTGALQDALAALENGKKVLLCPTPDVLKGIEGKFVPVFWSPVHFPDQPGTMGLLVNAKHKALTDFPTENHSNWQWWDLTIKSKTLIAVDVPEKAIIVRVIDNFMRNQSLANLFEAKIGKGKLIFCSIDILSDLDKRLQAKQLRYSLLKYMNSSGFTPEVDLNEEVIRNFFK